jgi:dTDP-L-rhamnose 4-epimerase
MTEKILITGGAGFIGSHLTDSLLRLGHHVRVFDNLEPQVHGGLRERGQKPAYLNPEAEFILGDVRNQQDVEHALTGMDVIFHFAARVGIGQSMYEIVSYTSTNALGAAILLQAVINAKQRPRKLIVASSMSIYGEGAYTCPVHGSVYPKLRPTAQLQRQEWELRCPVVGCAEYIAPIPTNEDKPLCPTSIYAINKRDHEEMFLSTGFAYNIPTVALRFFNVYGAHQALSNPYTGVAAIFSSRLLNNKPPVVFEDGMQRRDFIHVSDIVQANLLVMDSSSADFSVFNVGSGRAITILDVAHSLIQHLGVPLQPEVSFKFRSGDIRHCYGDIQRLQALGYQPRVKFEEGISELVEWVRQQTTEDSFEQSYQELVEKGLAK